MLLATSALDFFILGVGKEREGRVRAGTVPVDSFELVDDQILGGMLLGLLHDSNIR